MKRLVSRRKGTRSSFQIVSWGRKKEQGAFPKVVLREKVQGAFPKTVLREKVQGAFPKTVLREKVQGALPKLFPCEKGASSFSQIVSQGKRNK